MRTLLWPTSPLPEIQPQPSWASMSASMKRLPAKSSNSKIRDLGVVKIPNLGLGFFYSRIKAPQVDLPTPHPALSWAYYPVCGCGILIPGGYDGKRCPSDKGAPNRHFLRYIFATRISFK